MGWSVRELAQLAALPAEYMNELRGWRVGGGGVGLLPFGDRSLACAVFLSVFLCVFHCLGFSLNK